MISEPNNQPAQRREPNPRLFSTCLLPGGHGGAVIEAGEGGGGGSRPSEKLVARESPSATEKRGETGDGTMTPQYNRPVDQASKRIDRKQSGSLRETTGSL